MVKRKKGMIILPVRKVFKQLYLAPIERGWFRSPIDWEWDWSANMDPLAICHPRLSWVDARPTTKCKEDADGVERWWVRARSIKTGMFLRIRTFTIPERQPTRLGGERLPKNMEWGYTRCIFYRVILKTGGAITLKRVPRSRLPKRTAYLA